MQATRQACTAQLTILVAAPLLHPTNRMQEDTEYVTKKADSTLRCMSASVSSPTRYRADASLQARALCLGCVIPDICKPNFRSPRKGLKYFSKRERQHRTYARALWTSVGERRRSGPISQKGLHPPAG